MGKDHTACIVASMLMIWPYKVWHEDSVNPHYIFSRSNTKAFMLRTHVRPCCGEQQTNIPPCHSFECRVTYGECAGWLKTHTYAPYSLNTLLSAHKNLSYKQTGKGFAENNARDAQQKYTKKYYTAERDSVGFRLYGGHAIMWDDRNHTTLTHTHIRTDGKNLLLIIR